MDTNSNSSTKHFVIDRSKWLRGDSETSTLLREADCNMCCLGFVGIQSGYKPEEMESIDTPGLQAGLHKETYPQPLWPAFLLNLWPDGMISSSDIASELMEINDDKYRSDQKREEDIKEIFEQHGYTVEFIN